MPLPNEGACVALVAIATIAALAALATPQRRAYGTRAAKVADATRQWRGITSNYSPY